MGFQLVRKLVTLNDLERHNGRYFALLYQIRQFFVKLVEDNPTLSAKN